MTAILRDASGKMHHGILFDRRLGGFKGMSPGSTALSPPQATAGLASLAAIFAIKNPINKPVTNNRQLLIAAIFHFVHTVEKYS